MEEENKNVGLSVAASLPLREQAKRFTEFAKTARDTKMQETNNKIDTNMQKMFTYGLNSTDHWTAQECNKDIRITQVAQWINSHFYWGNKANEVENDPRWLVNWWLASNMVDGVLNQYWQMAIDYIGDESNELCDASEFYSNIGWDDLNIAETLQDQSQEQDSSTWQNIAQAWIDLPVNMTKPIYSKLDDFAAWFSTNVLWNEEGRWEEYKAEQTEKWDTLADKLKLSKSDRESLEYIVADFGLDVGITSILSTLLANPEAALVKYWTKWKRVEKILEKYPKLFKALWGAYQWSKDITIYNAINWEFDAWDTMWGWILWGVWNRLLNTNAAKRIGTWMQTEWLMTTTRAKNIINKIKDTVKNVPTWEDLANFMTEYGLTWSKEAIVTKATELYQKWMKMVDAILSKVEDKIQSKAVDDAIDALITKMESKIASWTPEAGYEESLKFLKWLKEQWKEYSAIAVERVKRLIDKEISMFNLPGNVKDGYDAWVAVRREIQNLLEKAGAKYGDVWKLNNIVQTSYWIMEWVKDNLSKEFINKIASKYWLAALPWIPAVKDIMDWDYKWAIENWLMAMFLWNTFFRTHMGSLLNRLSWTSRKEVADWLTTEWRTKLSEWASEELANILKSSKSFVRWIKEFSKDVLTHVAWDTAILWVEWLGELGSEVNSRVYTEEI